MAASRTLLQLPEEVISSIISYIPDSALLALSLVSLKLNRICSSPLELRARCMRYKYWDNPRDIEAKKANPRPAEVNWKQIFLYRYNVDRSTTALLNAIIEHPTDHIPRFNRIADFGYDAKGCLARHLGVANNDVDDPLARRWHATMAIQYIHRRRALQVWKRVSQFDDVPLEEALAALELFDLGTASGGIEDTMAEFDRLAKEFQRETPEFFNFPIDEKAVTLINWMWSNGFKGAPTDRYRALKNTFVGMTVRTSTARTAIPLTLVTIFCGLARRVGVTAYACGYPNHVYAMVQNESTGKYLYYDVFNVGGDPHMDKRQLIDTLPLQPFENSATLRAYLSPASTKDMVSRQSNNILLSLRLPPLELLSQNRSYPAIDQDNTLYAALTALAILGPRPMSSLVVQQLIERIPTVYPMDVRFLEEEILPKAELPQHRQILARMCNALRAEDSGPRMVSRRNVPDNQAIKYRVGTVFQHKRYQYTGVIYGWTRICKLGQGKDWIRAMKVDSLSKGRNQPFYNVLVGDEGVRYVAEENIIPVKLDAIDIAHEFTPAVGKYFKRYCEEEGRFVSNVRHEFPDD